MAFIFMVFRLFIFSLLCSVSQGQMLLGAPGLEIGDHYITTTPESRGFDLGYYYMYRMLGFYGRTDADNVPDTYISKQGCFTQTHGSKAGSRVYAWATGSIQLNNKWYPRTLHLQTNRPHVSTGDKVFSGKTLQFYDQDISVDFHMVGNTLDPDGYMVIFGAVMKAPPIPQGRLILDSVVREDEKALVGYSISKPTFEDIYEEYYWDPSTWTEDYNPGL